MRLHIKVIPNSKENRILGNSEEMKVHVKSVPEKNKANNELVSLIADYFKVKKKNVRIIKGKKSRKKVVEIAKEKTKINSKLFLLVGT